MRTGNGIEETRGSGGRGECREGDECAFENERLEVGEGVRWLWVPEAE